MHFNIRGMAMAALALTATASPVNQTEVEAAVNATMGPYLNANMLGAQRHEVPWFVTCARFNKFLFKEWIVNVPETWWKEKHQNGNRACEAWREHMKASIPGGGTIFKECWDMKDKQHLSGKPHYLHMRFTTATWSKDRQVESGMWAALDKAHWKDKEEFNNLQVGCGGYNSKCRSRWIRNNRCYHEDGTFE